MKTMIPTRPALPACRKHRSFAFTLIELLVVISIIAILAGIALPVMTIVLTNAAQTNDLANAKQVGLGLRLYSADNNGYFPTLNGATGSGTATNSNQAFLNIVPAYVPSQKIFYVRGSGWSTGQAAVELSTTTGTLQAGSNGYAYVLGLQDSWNTNFPLLADAFAQGTSPTGPGTYSSAQGQQGGVWKGRKAIVVRIDDSAKIEKVGGPGMTNQLAVYANGANTDNSSSDIFTVGSTWLPSCQVLNPETP